jgi:hypothetical protein
VHRSTLPVLDNGAAVENCMRRSCEVFIRLDASRDGLIAASNSARAMQLTHCHDAGDFVELAGSLCAKETVPLTLQRSRQAGSPRGFALEGAEWVSCFQFLNASPPERTPMLEAAARISSNHVRWQHRHVSPPNSNPRVLHQAFRAARDPAAAEHQSPDE